MKLKILIIILFFLLLSACGQMGPLYLPHQQHQQANHPIIHGG